MTLEEIKVQAVREYELQFSDGRKAKSDWLRTTIDTVAEAAKGENYSMAVPADFAKRAHDFAFNAGREAERRRILEALTRNIEFAGRNDIALYGDGTGRWVDREDVLRVVKRLLQGEPTKTRYD